MQNVPLREKRMNFIADERDMAAERPTVLNTNQARQGETYGTMRYVLGIGTVLAIAIIGAIAVFVR